MDGNISPISQEVKQSLNGKVPLKMLQNILAVANRNQAIVILFDADTEKAKSNIVSFNVASLSVTSIGALPVQVTPEIIRILANLK